MILEKIALTLLLATGTPEIGSVESEPIPYSQPAEQQRHKIPEAILPEQRYDLPQSNEESKY